LRGSVGSSIGQAWVAAIYARVSSERQRQEQTIQSQTAALRELAEQQQLVVPGELIFEDDGFSGSSLQRPALERLRDRAFEGCFEVLLCHAPDRLARRYAYQVLVLEEFARGGIEVVFAKEPERSGSPEDELLRQFQGMIAEYEKAQIAERCRRGKLHRARAGQVSVLSNAPYGEDRAVAERAGCADQDRHSRLGVLDDLGDPAQPRLHRAGGVRSPACDRGAGEADGSVGGTV
jgi:DNA invertase Pin-like site-specific DNA recombinase